jgi:hypothetical protein
LEPGVLALGRLRKEDQEFEASLGIQREFLSQKQTLLGLRV